MKGPEAIQRWYSDGAPELHAVCREPGIRHKISEPHRSETNGAIERTNLSVIEGARCLLFRGGLPYKYWKFAITCFCHSYNFERVDVKKGTIPHVERHSEKFKGSALPFGTKIRYLLSAEKEVEKREKLESSLRDAIFTAYRMHTGGRWTGQYQLIDAEAFTEVEHGTGRISYVHSVREIYIPGSAADDPEQFPTFPVVEGTL